MLGASYYHRSFIILQARDEGFGIDEGREPTGYCKMEIRRNNGRIQIYIQDMARAEVKEGIYDIVLVSNQEEIKPEKLISIQVADNGKCEETIEIDPNNINGSGFALDNYHGITVVFRSVGGGNNLRFPLVGYSNKKVKIDWDTRVMDNLAKLYGVVKKDSDTGLGSTAVDGFKDSAEDQNRCFPEDDLEQSSEADNDTLSTDGRSKEFDSSFKHMPEKTEQPPIDEVIDPKDGVTPVTVIQNDEVEDEGSSREYNKGVSGDEMPRQEQETRQQPKENAQIEDNDYEEDAEEIDDLQSEDIYNRPISDMKQDQTIEKDPVADTSDYSNPAMEEEDDILSQDSIDNYNCVHSDVYWDKVKEYFTRLFETHRKVCPFDEGNDEVEWIRVDKSKDSYYPYSLHMNRPNEACIDHYLVGIVRRKGRVVYVVYGVPGIYSELPPMSMHGFSRWLPVKNGYGAGYWLIYIDSETGNIAYPY